MTGIFRSYTVSLKLAPFITPAGVFCPQTAEITFAATSEKKEEHLVLGHIPVDDIMDHLRGGQSINLNSCYVKDFSLSVYRRKFNLDRKEPVVIKGFDARNAFFESTLVTDFSYAVFEGEGVSFEGSYFTGGTVLFTGVKFGKGPVVFSNACFYNGNIEFTGAELGDGDFFFKNSYVGNGLKDFQDAHFGNGEVSFANTEFNNGELRFISSRFGDGKFSFKVARITGGKVDFHYSIFGNGEVTFERTEFGDSRVDFRAVDFGSGRVNFNRCVFGTGDMTFEGASGRDGKLLFKKSMMGTGVKDFTQLEMPTSEVNFEKSEFGSGIITFNNSRVGILSLKSCHLSFSVDLRLAEADFLDMSDTVIRDIIDIEPYDFSVNIGSLNMAGMRLIGKIYIDWERNKCRSMIENQQDTSLRQKAEQFRVLKENFSDTGKYDDEDEAYVLFKRYEARAILQEKLAEKRYDALFPYWFRKIVFDKVGLYATSPVRVLFSVLVMYLLFSLTYFLMMKFTSADVVSATSDTMKDLPTAFYHSAVTFFTIGYGDHYPIGAARIVSALEGFTGVFLMSYFTVAFVRKVLR